MKPYYEQDGITLYHGDCREVLPRLEACSVDLLAADLPYNVGKQYGVHDDRMEPAAYRAWCAEVLAACRRVSRGNLAWFPGTANALDAKPILEASRWEPVRLLGWHRREFAGDKWRGGPAMCWEPIVWASVTLPATYNRIFGTFGRDFLAVDATHGDPFWGPHPCPKPQKVMDWIVALFCVEGGLVLDPTCGSGTTLRAAKDAGLRAIGIEQEEKFCELTVKRLAQSVLFGVEGAA